MMVGGRTLTQECAEGIGADGYGCEPPACGAVGLAKSLIGIE